MGCVHINVELCSITLSLHLLLYKIIIIIIIIMSYCVASGKAHKVSFVLIADHNVLNILRESAAVSRSLMQFNVVSFALDSQLPLPWWHAYKTSCSSLLLLHYNDVWSFFFFFPHSFFICLSFLKEPWVRDKQTVAPSKDVLPCKQLPLQDKLLLFTLQGALIPVHQNRRGRHTLNTSVGVMINKW